MEHIIKLLTEQEGFLIYQISHLNKVKHSWREPDEKPNYFQRILIILIKIDYRLYLDIIIEGEVTHSFSVWIPNLAILIQSYA